MIDRELLRKRIEELHPLSESATALLDILTNPDHSIRDLVRVIECDGPLTIRVLNVVNSAAFSFPVKIESLEHAIVYLGRKNVVTIALSHSASELFGKNPTQSVSDLWEDAVKTAIAARLVAQRIARPLEPSLAFTGGLIRDIGKIALRELIRGGIDALDDCIASGSAHDVCGAERKITGIDHCEVGAQIAEHFKLTPRLAQLIRHHHKPHLADPRAQDLVDVVHLADAITSAISTKEKETSDGDLVLNVDRSSVNRVGFELADIEELCVELSAEYRSAQAWVNIERGAG